MIDVLLKGGMIVDGTGAPPWRGDVGVAGDQIILVENSITERSDKIIDIEGLAICPGFIDMHSHSDLVLPDFPDADNMIRQGITTEVVGNCGFSPAPVPEGHEAEFYANITFFRGSQDHWKWRTFGEYLTYMDQISLIGNIVPLVGHGPLRACALGFDSRPPSSDELRTMQLHLREAFEAGAWGLSSGLVYPPGCFANVEELTTLARDVGKYGGIYCSHVRGEGDTLIEAIEELIQTGEQANVSTQISHFKASGRRNWKKQRHAIELIERAIKNGLDLAADVMPTNLSGTTLMSLLPDWVKEGGSSEMQDRLKDPKKRELLKDQIRDGCAGWSNLIASTGFENFFIFGCPSNVSFQGRSLDNIANSLGTDPRDVIIDCVAQDGADVFVVFKSMDEKNVEAALVHASTMIGSDGWAHPTNGSSNRLPHPRSFGSYPMVLGKFVRERKIMELEQAIFRMTGKVASRLGLQDRGTLRPGYKADIVVFDPATVMDNTSLASPSGESPGIQWVIVNGQTVVNPQGTTGVCAGRTLRKTQHSVSH